MTETHPSPQLRRAQVELLDGAWGFAHDDGDVGRAERWFEDAAAFSTTIIVPFAPEAPASGIGDTGFHPVVWYRREVTATQLSAAGLGVQGERVILHVGAVDHTADVWVDGTHVAHHVGGQTSFEVDITDALEGDVHVVVVRAEDDPLDVALPRGKQDWHAQPHSIWYHRTTGIWRSVWLEAAPAVRISRLVWTPDLSRGTVHAEIELSARPPQPLTVSVELELDGARLAALSIEADTPRVVVDVPIAALRNGQGADELLWSPSRPRLVDAVVGLSTGDRVESYLGLRTVRVDGGRLVLNDRPFVMRSVLEQGYWPDTHYTPPSDAAMRAEVELALRLGFNAIRIHQKVEDPRFLYWCDRLGLAVWAEAAAAYEFSSRAVDLYSSEWAAIVRAQQSHPSILVWVPFNESWGIQEVSADPAQAAFSRALADLTRALDPSRPVIANDGWEHTGSDLVTVHDYEGDGEVLRERYSSAERISRMLAGRGPHGRPMSVAPSPALTPPIMVTEFGGVRFETGAAHADGWGYSDAADAAGYEERLAAVVGAIRQSEHVVGFCYTQLTDTAQEVNGLCDENRVPKLPVETIRRIIAG
ncbi:glycoside hydrolase family 2 protein [Salinibacterium soli]|uniref:Glycoside hydrolase family 2 TIM barrel-domain containing protein n=1 Tax=Antiquaquibacter soli TaxID=3064523 RepID=A0ABT9BN45_9MICO|nr:sugar-binding domain-containing protein [Protaetiibacter sp. WY-16]MDO7882425.1 glycoside hydrolase family 2 TIM barrel-domain containing protein [Protaetiibacter sp. WY-16]